MQIMHHSMELIVQRHCKKISVFYYCCPRRLYFGCKDRYLQWFTGIDSSSGLFPEDIGIESYIYESRREKLGKRPAGWVNFYLVTLHQALLYLTGTWVCLLGAN